MKNLFKVATLLVFLGISLPSFAFLSLSDPEKTVEVKESPKVMDDVAEILTSGGGLVYSNTKSATYVGAFFADDKAEVLVSLKSSGEKKLLTVKIVTRGELLEAIFTKKAREDKLMKLVLEGLEQKGHLLSQ